MKKIISVALVIAMVFALCIPTLAVDSPAGKKVVKIGIVGANGIAVDKYESKLFDSKDGLNFTFTVTPNTDAQFVSWSVFKVVVDGSGKRTLSPATIGVDYEIVSNDDTTNAMVVKALTDVVVSASYENKTSVPENALVFSYKIIAGANQEVSTSKSDTTAAFKSNAAFSEFVKVIFDGKELDAKYYDVSEDDSTVVTLKNSFLKTLSNGEHTINIVSVDGYAETTFTVSGNASTSPKTGDDMLFAIAFVVALAGVAFASKKVLVK